MEYEWDEAKRRSNLAKHGVDFAEASTFDWAAAVRFPDERKAYGEDRWLGLGTIGGRVYAMIYTMRAARIRIISLRKANNKEVARYESETGS